MDVDLARPRLLSLDTLLALVALALAGLGAYRVFTDVGTEAGIVGWILIGVAWLMVFPRMFLRLELVPEGVQASLVTGTRTVGYDEVVDARKVEGMLSLRLGGVKASAYHAGRFRLSGYGPVVAYASRSQGPFVLLNRQGEPPVVVSPKDPDAFLDEVRERKGLDGA